MKNNVLYNPLPEYWNGYKVNTDFRIGIQINLLLDDPDINDNEKDYYLLLLLFGDESDNLREYPQDAREIAECIKWFLNGWYHDKTPPGEKDNTKIIDYYIDQGRIYADFMQIYRIDLNVAQLHYWAFQWLLWNMPHDLSSFKQVIEIRTKKPRPKASAEEIKAINDGKAIYSLAQTVKKALTDAEKEKIDAFDVMMNKVKQKKEGGVDNGSV